MTADAIEFYQLGIAADDGNPARELSLLLWREQDICTHTHDECPLQLEFVETYRQRPAIFCEIE